LIGTGTIDEKGWPKNGHGLSKLLVEILCRNMGRDEKVLSRGIQCYGIDPGWVATGPGGPDAPKSVAEGIRLPMELIEREFVVSQKDQGKLFGDSELEAL
jgi:hypothetical protein